MADLALVFHWTLETMSALSLGELAHWRGLAIEKWNAVHGGKD